MVIEEMFPLNCSTAELDQIIDGSKSLATGWLGLYWGKTIAEYPKQPGNIADALTREWLEYLFERRWRWSVGERPAMAKRIDLRCQVRARHLARRNPMGASRDGATLTVRQLS